MNRQILHLVWLTLIVAVAVASPGKAHPSWDGYYLTPSAGGYVFEGNQNIENGIAAGLGLGYQLNERWDAEAVFHFIDTEVDRGSDSSVNGYLGRVEGLYSLLPGRLFRPYLALGAGWLLLDPNKGSSDSSFVADYGLGVEYRLSPMAALRGDIRHILAFGDPDNNLLYTLGIAVGKDTRGAVPPIDSDGDGVADRDDKCPDTPRGVVVDRHGCPLDSDGDGVADRNDQCPDTPRGVAVDRHGCPLDSDGDGVYDNVDACPGTAKGIMVDERGCPLSFTLHIEFDFDKADIRPAYHQQLAEAADFIRKHPAPRYLVGGHTDSRGDAAYNQQLSERRAQAVADYLVTNFGIEAKRLAAKGFGESQPVADNATEEGRQKNRRVEIVCCVILPE